MLFKSLIPGFIFASATKTFWSMKTGYLLLGLVLLSLLSCKTNKQNASHNSMNSLTWEGIYTGSLPCADCQGIKTMLKLNKDLTYEIESKYLGKSDEIHKSAGTFTWDKSGNKISLNNSAQNIAAISYAVGENRLTQLDAKGNIVTGELASMYILNKQTSSVIEKYWKLIELNGNTIILTGNPKRQAHLIMKALDNRIGGNGGCNSFFGNYEIPGNNRISFSKIGATKMACNNMEIENQFFKVLEMTDNFTMRNDTLSLNKAKMAPLARFVVVNMNE